TEFADLKPLLPIFLSYLLSFIYIAIYWNNHHHLFHATEHVTASIMWANLHLLFWESLVPFVTGWMGENHFAAVPTALYGFVLLACALAWTILQSAILADEANGRVLATAIGNDLKGKLSLLMYAAAIPAAVINEGISDAL